MSLALLTLLVACGGGGLAPDSAPLATTGPGADYPMVLGAPFTVDGVTYTPNDRMNYDAVGYAALGSEGGAGVSAAHRTLPLPSYLEVTAIDTGKTILVRVERRGPMSGKRLVELSPGAAAQLGIAGLPRAPVRVRRVNPPEVERAILRSGQAAPARMDTPKSLLAVLTRKLEAQEGIAPVIAPTSAPTPTTTPLGRPVRTRPVPMATPSPATAPAPQPAVNAEGKWSVQVAAFSTRERAASVAAKLGAQAVQSGNVWRVRMGPFASQAEAQAALAQAKAAGYRDARIQRAD